MCVRVVSVCVVQCKFKKIRRAVYTTAIHRAMCTHEPHIYCVNLFFKYIVVLKFL
jgi:hypothetical protein